MVIFDVTKACCHFPFNADDRSKFTVRMIFLFSFPVRRNYMPFVTVIEQQNPKKKRKIGVERATQMDSIPIHSVRVLSTCLWKMVSLQWYSILNWISSIIVYPFWVRLVFLSLVLLRAIGVFFLHFIFTSLLTHVWTFTIFRNNFALTRSYNS